MHKVLLGDIIIIHHRNFGPFIQHPKRKAEGYYVCVYYIPGPGFSIFVTYFIYKEDFIISSTKLYAFPSLINPSLSEYSKLQMVS